jgi:phospholipid/cholesterol/gamma-HCH transport system substrate-binding protein
MKKFLLRIFGGPDVHGHRTVSTWKLGLGFLVAVLIVGVAVFNKARLTTWFTPGDSVQVHFAADYRLRPYFSQAKISFVPVGMVTGDEELADHTSLVTVKLYGDNKSRLGNDPSATVRPTTLLGGNYFLDLSPGGDLSQPYTEDEIPVTKTHLPVELDKIIRAFQPNALAGVQGTIAKLDDTLQGGGKQALQRFVADAPDSLNPAGQVLDAVRGRNPETDLTDVVSGLESTSQQLSQPQGRLDGIIRNLSVTSAVFGQHADDFSVTLDELPGALHSAQRGLTRLNTTLDVLDDTADDIRPEAEELDHTLGHIDPILCRAVPVVHSLKDVLHDARPVLKRLVPDVQELNDVLNDFRGPVLDRVNGPISALLLNPYHGTGPYAQSVSNKPVFQEVVYALATLDRATRQDRNGSSISFQGSLNGLEPTEGVIANNGAPRGETLQRSLVDPARISPPIQSPGEAPTPGPDKTLSNPLLPNGLGNPVSHREGR